VEKAEPNNSLSCVLLNARSIANLRNANSMTAEIFIEGNFPDLIAVTETWMKSDYSNSLLPYANLYDIVRRDRSTNNEKGGGVLLMIKKSLMFSHQELTLPCSPNFEAIAVKLQSKSFRFTVTVCYKPNVKDVHMLPDIDNMLLYIDNLKMPYVVLGDFNLPGIDWSVPCASKVYQQDLFLETFLKYGLYQKVEEPTRGENILDLVFCSECELVDCVSVREPMGASDHETVWFSLNASNVSSSTTEKYQWHKMDEIGIMAHLEMTNWCDILSDEMTVAVMCETFVQYCYDVFDRYVPKSKPSQKISNKCVLPNNIKNLLSRKKLTHRVLKTNKTAANKNKYRNIAKKCDKAIFLHNMRRESQVLLQPNSKKFFSYVGSKLKTRAAIPTLVANGIEYVTDDEKASALNLQFCSVFNNDLLCNSLKFQFEPFGDEPGNVLSDMLFTRRMVSDALKRTPSQSAPGPDGVPAIFLRNFAIQLATPLQKLFQASFDSKSLPPGWKIGHVSSIHKRKGPKSDPEMYRPVTLTDIICKRMESCVKDSVSEHLLDNRLISRQQHGFLAKRSVQTQLLECVNDWSKALDSGYSIDVIYIDVSKAFDTISHELLKQKLKKYGIGGKFYHWISDFLSNRTQKVRVASSFSNSANVISGVPQGSVLGPLLFLIFINDLPSVITYSSIKIFADDSKIYFKFNPDADYNMFCHDVRKVFGWIESNQLAVATNKCELLHLGNSNPHHEFTIKNVTIPSVVKVRDLGVFFTSDLKSSHHVSIICKRAYQQCGMIFRAFSCKSPIFLRAMYLTYVRPLLEANSCVWSPNQIKDIEKLDKIQRYFTRRISNFSGLTYSQRLVVLNLKTLESRRWFF
jgi:hypothetical protein